MKRLIAVYLAWIMATLATAGSLYASEVAQLPLCVLCWYQRILMYPLVLIIAVGILRKDESLPFYVLPLSVAGAVTAFYHYLLQQGVVPSLVPCTLGVPCATRSVEWLGFVTLPLLSFLAFNLITICMVSVWKLRK